MKIPHALPVLAALALATSASAQQVVFSEGFESGLGAWTATGLWNLEDSTDTCGLQAAPFAEGTKAAWYGSSSTCSYETGVTNSGTLTLNDWVTLPTAPSISVHFWMRSHTEYCFADQYGDQYDVFSLVVTRQTPAGNAVSVLCTPGGGTSVNLGWHERRFDISQYAGSNVKLSFQFGTGDNLANNYLGWFVDDVQILAEPGTRVCPPAGFNTGCPCFPAYIPVAGGCRNSTNQSATLLTSGSISVATDSLQLRVENMPPSASAILTQANGSGSNVVFGDGIRCVSGGLMRMGAAFAVNGVATWPVGPESISVRGLIPAGGATKFYYVFYRDVIDFCTPSSFNLTEMQRIVWVP